MSRALLRPMRLLAAALLLPALAGCSDAGIGLVGSGVTEHMDVDVDGPLLSLGAWRYYDGVRLLECDIRLTATAEGGEIDSRAVWLDGVVDLYDLRTGEYLGTDYLYPGDLQYLWGDREIEAGERRTGRALRYTSYGPFRAYFLFRYDADGRTRETQHRSDCR